MRRWSGHCGWMLLVALVVGVIQASFLHDRPTYMSDTVTYVEGARSLAAGNGYFRGDRPITTWPPGYSLLLSLPIRMGLDTVVAFKAVNVLCSVLAVVLLFWLLQQFVARPPAAVLAMIAGTYFPWIYYTHAILADIGFVVLVQAFLVSAILYVRQTKTAWLVWASVAVAVSLLLRSAGIALLPALVLVAFLGHVGIEKKKLLYQGSMRGGLALLPSVAVLGAWFLRNYRHTGQVLGYRVDTTSGYALSLEEIGITDPSIWDRLYVNLRGYLHIFVLPDQTAIARDIPWFLTVGSLVVWGLILLGGCLLLRTRKGWLLAATSALYMGMLLLNPWYDIRYILPLFGVLLLFLYVSVTWIAGWISDTLRVSWVRPAAAAGFLGVVLLGSLTVSLASPPARNLRARTYRGTLQRMYAACQFLRDEPGDGAVLVAGGAGFVPVWTGRQTVSLLAHIRDGEVLLDAVPEHVEYVLFTEGDFMPYRQRYLEPWFERTNQDFERIYQDESTEVWGR